MDLAAATVKAAEVLAKEVRRLYSMLKTIEADHPDEAQLAGALEVRDIMIMKGPLIKPDRVVQ